MPKPSETTKRVDRVKNFVDLQVKVIRRVLIP